MGTGSTKGVLVEPDGTVVATAVRRHAMSLPRPRWAEMDAEADWWGDAAAVIAELVARGDRDAITAVAAAARAPTTHLSAPDNPASRLPLLNTNEIRPTGES